jgi:hypothetical protein
MFQIKVYDESNTILKKIISNKDVLSDISFSMNLNGWLWNQVIELAYDINDNTVSLWDIIRITMYNENNKSWLQIYMWYVNSIWRRQTTARQTVTLNCLWIASLLTEYNASISYTWTDKVWDVAKRIVDSFNATYWSTIITYSSTTIDDWNLMPAGNFNGNYLQNLESLAKLSWFKCFIDWYWILHFKAFSTSSDHLLMNKKNIEEVVIDEDMEWLINSVRVLGKYRAFSWWISRDAYVDTTYEDAVSVATYWRRYKLIENIYTDSQAYVNQYAIQYVNDNKSPKKKTTLIINRNYNLESLKPWDTIKINNFEYLLSNVKIIKMNYTPDKVTLYLDEYTSFGWEIKKVF